MRRVSPKILEFANRLIDLEAAKDSSEPHNLVASRICEKLRPQLATLLGNVGFRSLLSRALSLAQKENAAIRDLHINGNGALHAPAEIASRDPSELSNGNVFLIAQLLELLVSFIGEHLTLHMVSEIWPTLPIDDPSKGNGDKSEKAEK